MDRVEPRTEDFPHLVQVMKICTAEVAAGVARSRRIKRPQVIAIAAVL